MSGERETGTARAREQSSDSSLFASRLAQFPQPCRDRL